jgi:acyl-coenzyme A thioesterase PaaI-like protein
MLRAMKASIRERVLGAIARNRTPGFHFAGNFLEVSYDRIDPHATRVSFEPGAHCAGADGQTSIGAIAMAADIALVASVRAALDSATARLATVSMHLQFTGMPLQGRVEGEGAFAGFIEGAAARQGLARVSVLCGGRLACFGTGAFMALAPPPGVSMHPVVTERTGATPPLAEGELDRDELAILRHADAALAREACFIDAFWGYEPRRTEGGALCVMKNGAHVGNRVGHAQGGLMVGLAATAARAALAEDWALASITVCFVSPGEGAELEARAAIAHRGRETAVVRTVVSGDGKRRVLEVLSTHARRGAAAAT